jgi:hypothetical protein
MSAGIVTTWHWPTAPQLPTADGYVHVSASSPALTQSSVAPHENGMIASEGEPASPASAPGEEVEQAMRASVRNGMSR